MRLLTVSVLALGISASFAAADDLTGAQIKEKLIGHTMKWKSEKFKVSGTSNYNADGTATIKIDGQAEETGKWRIKGNNLCDKFGKKKESCSTRIDQIDEKVFYFEPYQSISIIVD
jgi:hypothetical protein